MIIIPNITQGSEQWEALRRIRPTASRFSEIVTAAKGDLSKSAKAYAAEIIAQQLFDADPDAAVKWTGNGNTDNGNEREPLARAAFTKLTGLSVEQVGFCTTDDHFAGCSPDGLIPTSHPQDPEEDCQCDDQVHGEYCYHCDWKPYWAGVEIKCPMSKTHAKYVMDGVLPDDYKQQVHGSMYVTGLREWHFFSWFPELQPFHLVVKWDAYTDKVAAALDEFRILYAKTRNELVEKLTGQKAA